MELSELLMGLITGLGLSAACGFRIFVPLLIMNLAHHAEWLPLSGGFEWIGSTPALIVFASATVLEIGAYYIPFVDNLLDAAAAPTAVVAGTLVTASQIGDANPVLTWSLAAIVGGGAAGLVQGLTTVVRQFSAFATAGFGNPLVSTAEAGASILVTVSMLVVPVVTVFVVLALLVFAVKKFFYRGAAELEPAV
ncbi:MAG TPA: DUF4126 domain-containing protein [Thermoanaerobaculia bacterium]